MEASCNNCTVYGENLTLISFSLKQVFLLIKNLFLLDMIDF